MYILFVCARECACVFVYECKFVFILIEIQNEQMKNNKNIWEIIRRMKDFGKEGERDMLGLKWIKIKVLIYWWRQIRAVSRSKSHKNLNKF